MINFWKLPIYLHQVSQVNIDTIGPLRDGIHFYVNVDCTAEQYIQLYEAIVAVLDKSINQDGTGGAGKTYSLKLDRFQNLNEFWLPAYTTDTLFDKGMNPIVFIAGTGVCIWGSNFVYKGKIYPYYSMQGHCSKRPDNLNIFAHQHGAYVSDELVQIELKRAALIREVEDLDCQIEQKREEINSYIDGVLG